MRIGIDIDDVITDTSLSMKEYINKYDKTGDVSKYMVEVMRGEIPNENVKNFIKNNCIEIFKNAKVKENASTVMKRLLDTGNEIFIVTSRGEQNYKDSVDLTLKYFEENNIRYTKILFDCFEKAKICKENNIDVMVDDSAKYCSDIQEENIKGILFTSDVNKTIDTNIERVNNWLELEEKINKIADGGI